MLITDGSASGHASCFVGTNEDLKTSAYFIACSRLSTILPSYHSAIMGLRPPMFQRTSFQGCGLLYRRCEDLLSQLTSASGSRDMRFLGRPTTVLYTLSGICARQGLARTNLGAAPLLSSTLDAFSSLTTVLYQRGEKKFLGPHCNSKTNKVVTIECGRHQSR